MMHKKEGMEGMEKISEMQEYAQEVRRKNYNAPDVNKDYSECDERYERRMSDRSKPAPSDEYKKGMM